MTENFAARLANLDTTLFEIMTSTTDEDRRSLLLAQHVVRSAFPSYRYLEIGSDIGGSLFPHLLDPNCMEVVSIDPRPPSQPDERGREFPYPNNSTERMVQTLRGSSAAACLAKLRTFDADSSVLRTGVCTPTLTLIDGEHTTTAAVQDFLNVLGAVAKDAVILFHDSDILIDATCNIRSFLEYLDRPFRAYYLRDAVFVLVLGEIPGEENFSARSLSAPDFIARSKAWLARVRAEAVA